MDVLYRIGSLEKSLQNIFSQFRVLYRIGSLESC